MKKLTDDGAILTVGDMQNRLRETERLVEYNFGLLHKDAKKRKQCRPVRIRYDGEWLVLPSGKTIWKRIGDAKSALRNAMPDVLYYDPEIRGYRLRETHSKIGDCGAARLFREHAWNYAQTLVEFVEVDGWF